LIFEGTVPATMAPETPTLGAGRRVDQSELQNHRILSSLYKRDHRDPEEANWEIVARGTRHTLERGDPIQIQLFFSGYGRPSWAKLAFYPPPQLLNPHLDNEARRGPIAFDATPATGTADFIDTNAGTTTPIEFAVEDPSSVDIEEFGAVVGIADGFFFVTGVSSGDNRDVQRATPDPSRRAVSEIMFIDDRVQPPRASPPIVLRARVADNAPGGDYSWPFVLTYATQGNVVRSSRFTLPLHVKTIWELDLPQAIAIGSAGGVVVGSAIEIGSWLLSLHLSL
jgi:hypothetical protein